jgi:hypothetical protein
LNNQASIQDINFTLRFEAGAVAPSEFHHRDHLRLAYVYLCENDTLSANDKMRQALKKFLKDNGVPPEKYHETLTYSWVQAVRHFMENGDAATSFDGFIAVNASLLDMDIMLTHYTRDTLFSGQARTEFVQPDVQQIPQYP